MYLGANYRFRARWLVTQLLARRTINREVESSNQASDSGKCHRVAKALFLQIPPAPRK